MFSSTKEQIQTFVDGVSASIAVLEKDITGQEKVIACNSFFSNMFGGSSQLTENTPFLLKDLIPRYNRIEFLEYTERCFNEQTPLEFEQAFDTKEGTQWWRISLKPIKDEREQVYRLLITGQNITIKVTLAHELKLASSRFESVIEAVYDCIITINQREKIVLFNKAAQELFGYREEEILGQSIELLLPHKYRHSHSEHIDRFTRSPIKSRQMEERNRVYGMHKDGSEFPVEIAISKINVGGMVEFTAIVRDISDRVRLIDHLANQASVDHLTGLLNRREFEEQGKTLFAHARKTREPVSLLILDIDEFKKINDAYGHDGGDEVLQLLSRVGATTIHHRDIFVRHGGEEFVILMPDTDKDAAMAMAERVRKIFEQQNFTHYWKEQNIPFTVSIGVATASEHDTALEQVLKRADVALYQAKDRGRNRSVFGD
jgi:diguanylate cyclase (GGDEF)-like protein/PAS domain S-box-containing protein